MNHTEFETLSTRVGIEAASVVFMLREVEKAFMDTAADAHKNTEPFPSVLQSAEDERRRARNEADDDNAGDLADHETDAERNL